LRAGMKISRIGEFELIERIKKKVEKRYPTSQNRRIIVGIGDDAAVIEPYDEKLLVATTDTMVESVHFSTEDADFEKIGYKAMVSSISDIIRYTKVWKEIWSQDSWRRCSLFSQECSSHSEFAGRSGKRQGDLSLGS